MSYESLITSLGFEADPFAAANADEEDRLEQYFIAPPFFTSVFGQPKVPKSVIVFAPRGAGKTALKRKIELSSEASNFLCLTYNKFDITSKVLLEIDSEYHLNNIVEILLVAVITAINEKGLSILSNDDKHIIYLMVKGHLSQIDQTRLKNYISSIKNFADKAKEIWNKFTGPIGLVANALLEKIGLGSAEIKKFECQDGHLGTLIDQLRILLEITKKLDFLSVYVLVDKIDENPLTTTAEKAYSFVAPLITNLELLEEKGFGFKIFLWDLILDDYRSVSRPDRIPYYTLAWNHDQLALMLSERLKAFSGKAIYSLDDISDAKFPIPLDQAVAILAQGSPRNVVRICKEILDQQSELDSDSKKLSIQAVRAGFNRIAENISRERFPDSVINELQRTQRCDFTIRYIYSDVFKFTQQAALNKVRTWENLGAVLQLGTIRETEGSRPSNHYGLTNILLAKHIFLHSQVDEFLQEKVRFCPKCNKVLLRDWDLRSPQQCNFCQYSVSQLTRWPVPKANSQRFSIMVAHLENDPQREHERLIIEALKEIEGVQTLSLDRTISLEGTVPEVMEKQGQEEAQRYIKESGASVLIWGAVRSRGNSAVYKLYWTPGAGEARKPERYGAPMAEAQLRLPEVFWGDLVEILRLATTSKAAEFEAQEGRYVADRLPPFISRLKKLLQASRGQPDWDADTRGTMLVILGNALSTFGEQSGQNKPLEEAVQAYQEALEEENRKRAPLKWAMTQNNLGLALTRQGDRESSTVRLEGAIKAYQAALQERTSERMPLDWAMTQYNLGIALAIVGECENNTERLKEAVAAFQAALEVFKPTQASYYAEVAKASLQRAETRLQERQK